MTHNIYVPKLKVKVTIWGQSSKYVSAITQRSNKASFIELYRSQSQSEVEGQVISSHYQNITEASLIKIHEKVNNNEIVCHNQN